MTILFTLESERGWVSIETKETDRDFGKFFITYRTFDGYVDDGTFESFDLAKIALIEAVDNAEKISQKLSHLPIVTRDMIGL